MAHQFCTFFVGDLFLGIEVEKIQEVLHDTTITPVPLAHPAVSGLINLRGQIVTAIDLRKRFGLNDHDQIDSRTTLVLGAENHLLSLVVDRVGDVVEVKTADYEVPPDTLKGEARKIINGAYKLERNLLLVLDVNHTLSLGSEGDV